MEIKNLKYDNFPLRGKVGELIAKSHIPYSSRVDELSPSYFYKEFSFGILPEKIRDFLIKYRKSFDLFRFVVSEDGYLLKEIEIYEVKTQVEGRNHLPAITNKSLFVYNQAQILGIKAKTVLIIFFDNWHYNISVNEFDSKSFELNDGNKKQYNF
ncbi:hypothetical protein J4437_00875 [Candidatus Woesearchaeota archaeon]|nr:hypothetical protein [Candidatus Woesearchaeota archaeon]